MKMYGANYYAHAPPLPHPLLHPLPWPHRSQFLVCTMKQSPSLVAVSAEGDPDIKPLPTEDEVSCRVLAVASMQRHAASQDPIVSCYIRTYCIIVLFLFMRIPSE